MSIYTHTPYRGKFPEDTDDYVPYEAPTASALEGAKPRNFFGAMSSRTILEIGEWYQWKDPKFYRASFGEQEELITWFKTHYPTLDDFNSITVDYFPNHRSHIGPHFDKITRMEKSKVQVINLPVSIINNGDANTDYALGLVHDPCCEYAFIDKDKEETFQDVHYYDIIEWDSNDHRTWCIKNASRTLRPRIQFQFRMLQTKKPKKEKMPDLSKETDDDRRIRLADVLAHIKSKPRPPSPPTIEEDVDEIRFVQQKKGKKEIKKIKDPNRDPSNMRTCRLCSTKMPPQCFDGDSVACIECAEEA